MSRATPPTLLFDSTNAALWAEEVAAESAIPVEVVPAPAGSDAKCDLALITPADHLAPLEDALAFAGVPFRRWEAPG